MAIYFADSSFWIALIDNRDAHNSKAIEWSLKIRGSLVTTEAVLLETANTFSKPAWRPHVIALINHILTRSDVEIDYKPWQQGWQLFITRPDKSWSLTDCISMRVMAERNLTEVLTADTHFRQAGFRPLLLDTE